MSLPASDRDADLAALAWLVELGADEAICETPVDRFALPDARKETRKATAPAVPAETPAGDPPGDPGALAAGCADLAALRAAMAAFDGCKLKRGARNLVFADGNPAARVMIVGEAPGREEDREGRPFVGQSGQLLDRMFAAIGLARGAEMPDRALYITNVLPWRPPQNRDPSADEVAMMAPFLARHIALVEPDVLITMGNTATRALLGTTAGITRLRGSWAEAQGRPVMPMFHPAALLRDPEKKRAAWADLLAVQVRLEEARR